MLTIKQIIEASFPAVARIMNVNYTITEIQTAPNDEKIYYFSMEDPETGVNVPCVYTSKDEEKADTGEKRIELVRSLLVNGINCVTDLIEEKQQPMNVEETVD